MSCQLQPGAEGSLSESVHFPPTSSFLEHQGYQGDVRMGMAPPLSSFSRAPPPRSPFLHDDGRAGSRYVHSGGFDRQGYDYAVHRHSCGDHLELHSGSLLEHLLLQENQKALRIASLVQSQASGCLSGCLSCGLGEKRLRYKDSEERMVADQRHCCPRSVGEEPSRSVNLGAEADPVECADEWFRQPRPRESVGGVGERSQAKISFFEDELGRSLCQERRTVFPVSRPVLSHSQASHHIHDHQDHLVGAQESSVPIYGFSDGDGRVRQRWPSQRPAYSGNGVELDGWQRATRSVSRVGSVTATEQDRLSLPDIAAGSLPTVLVGSPHRPVGDASRPTQSARTTSQNLLRMSNSVEPSSRDKPLQEASTQRVVTQGPVSLTGWYIMKVQTADVGRVVETKVAVGGRLVQGGEHVKTSPIVNRLDFHKVVTEDGVEVSLEGSMDLETSTANGFSPGIVQCLCNGFPYMWKQLLRVRPVGMSSSLAVSESVGGLHPVASKCVSEDESQGVVDPNICKTIPKGIPGGSRDCEGNSTVGDVGSDAVAAVDEPSVIQRIASDAVGSKRVETEAVVTAGAETSTAVETEPVDPGGVERCEPPNAFEIEAMILGGGTTVRDEPPNADGKGTVEPEGEGIGRANTSNAIDEGCPLDVPSQQACDPCPTNFDPVPVSNPLDTDSLGKEAESGPTVDTTFVTMRRGRKNKKGPPQPVRSSARLQQRRTKSAESMPNLFKSSGPAQVEQVTVSGEVTRDNSGEQELGEILPDVQRAANGREKITRTSDIIGEVLKDLQEEDMEAANQGGVPGAGFVGIVVDPQPIQVEISVQVQDSGKNLLKDRDDVEVPKLNENDATEDRMEIEENKEMAPAASSDFENEKSEETAQAAPAATFKLVNEEMEEAAPVTPPELIQRKVQSRVDSRYKPSSEALPQASEERVSPELNARMTRSLKRRLRLSAISEPVADVAPVTRSSKRLRRPVPESNSEPSISHQVGDPLVQPVSNPDLSHQVEGPSMEPISNPVTPHHGEVNGFHARVRDLSTRRAKAVNCSNCKKPCSSQEVIKYKNRIASIGATPEHAVERTMKTEQEEYPPLEPQRTESTPGTSSLPKKGETNTSSAKRRSGRPKKTKSANLPAERRTTRRLKLDDSGEGPSEGHNPVPSKQSSRRTSIMPPPLPSPRVQGGLKGKVPEAFGLKTSRSGRLLVPALAYWRSQSIEYDKDGGIIAIFDGFQATPSDTGCFNFTPPQEKHAKKIQEKLCKAAATVKKRK